MQEYMAAMEAGEDRPTALNALVSQLLFETQKEWLQANPEADLDEAIRRFADALKTYRRDGVALRQTLEAAGFAAPSDMTALSYAADQLMRMERDTGEAEVKYSSKAEKPVYNFGKSFAEQVDDFQNNLIPADNVLLLGRTPLLYRQMGLSDLPIVMDQQHVSDALNGTKDADHTMTPEELKKMPQWMKNPVAVIESVTKQGKSVVAIVKAKINGKQTVMPIEINTTQQLNGKQYDANKVSSAYGKNNAMDLLTNAINKQIQGNTALYYINKTEARSLYARSGVQFPGTALQDGLNSSIQDAGSPVKQNYLAQTDTMTR